MNDQNQVVNSPSAQPVERVLNPIAIIKEAWSLTYGMKWAVIRRHLYIALLTLLLSMSAAAIVYVSTTAFDFTFSTIIMIINIVPPITFFLVELMTAYMATPLIMLGVRRSINLSSDINVTKRQCAAVKSELLKFSFTLVAFQLCTTALVLYFITAIPLLANTISTIITLFTSLLYGLSIPLMVIKKMNFSTAIKCTLIQLGNNFIPIILCFILYVFVSLLSMFIIPIPWILAMFYTMYGIMFRDIYGLKSQKMEQP